MSDTVAKFRRGRRPERNGLHGATVVLSLVLHIVGFGAAVGLPRLMPRRAPGAPVYVVDLVSLPPGAAAPAAPAPQPAPARRQAAPPAAVPKAKPQKPIKIPERDAPKRAAPPKPEAKPPADPEPAAKPAAPAATEPAGGTATEGPPSPPAGGSPAGGAVGVTLGGTGQSGSGVSDEYTFYLSLLDRNIRGAWVQPIYTGLDIKSATVALVLDRSGRILKVELMTPSGYDPLDRSVVRAVRDAAPFPPFPHFLGLDTLAVQIVFELDPGSLGADSPGE
jgi:TonB family protein